ncbi:cytochrome C assembly family protein [Sulfuriferula thiophila]|uniref:cytochrome C assembly family protein n=1 Tax=Sulfuriferula thiophila TaxID=1781211 RepID=UPI000F605606|nr:cytochrome c biogenesis protein CcsA [Sulfuriferula thiophila]
MSIPWLYPLVSLLYALVGWHFWRTRWHGVAETAAWEPFALLVPMSLHFGLLGVTTVTDLGVQLGIGNVLSMIAGLAILIYWLSSFHSRMEALNAPLAAIAAVAVLAPLVLPEAHLLANTELLAFRLHLLIALLAYSLFTIAALHATLMSIVEKRLHHVSNSDMTVNLPPLLTLESLLFRLIGLGFTLLTLTLVTGVLFSEEIFHKPAEFNHKTVFAVLSWLIYAVLLGGRRLRGWRGKVAVRWTWVGFAMLLLAYIGSRFVLETLLHRYPG